MSSSSINTDSIIVVVTHTYTSVQWNMKRVEVIHPPEFCNFTINGSLSKLHNNGYTLHGSTATATNDGAITNYTFIKNIDTKTLID